MRKLFYSAADVKGIVDSLTALNDADAERFLTEIRALREENKKLRKELEEAQADSYALEFALRGGYYIC